MEAETVRVVEEIYSFEQLVLDPNIKEITWMPSALFDQYRAELFNGGMEQFRDKFGTGVKSEYVLIGEWNLFQVLVSSYQSGMVEGDDIAAAILTLGTYVTVHARLFYAQVIPGYVDAANLDEWFNYNEGEE